MCHFPPGTPKRNAIGHRLPARITMNGRGRPLTSHEVVVAPIAATATRTGLSVHAELDTGASPTGVQVSDETPAAVPVTRHRFHGDWTCTLHPAQAGRTATVPGTPRPRPPGGTQPPPPPDALHDPGLTGMTRRQLDDMISTLTPVPAAHREQTLYTRRGSRPSLTGTGAGARLTPTERILATVLCQRKLATKNSSASCSPSPA